MARAGKQRRLVALGLETGEGDGSRIAVSAKLTKCSNPLWLLKPGTGALEVGELCGK